MVTTAAKPDAPEHTPVQATDDPHVLPAPVTLRLPDCWEPTDAALIEIARLNEPWRFELTAQRELVIMSPEGRGSTTRGAEILTDISIWNRQLGRGRVIGPQGGVRLPDTSMRMPDAAWMSAERWENQTGEDESLLQLCPELVVEIASVTDDSAEQQEKMGLWIQNGALLGWLIDPFAEVVWIYRAEREPERRERPDSLSGEDVCEGLEVSLERVWK